MKLQKIIAAEDGPAKTAALVSWIQALFADEEATPVLVGGAAVELYSGGAYTTGDIDLVGTVTAAARRALSDAGFKRKGRHWVHEAAQLFVEFPGSALGEDERAGWVEVEGQRVKIISPEDLLVDRLGAWQYWRSSVDGANALVLWLALQDEIDLSRLQARIEEEGWSMAWVSLREFAERWRDKRPSPEEIARWANAGPR